MGIIKDNLIIKLLFCLFLISEVYATEQTCIIGYGDADINLSSREYHLISPIKLMLCPELNTGNKSFETYVAINKFYYTSVFNNQTLKVCDKVYLTKYISSFINLDTRFWQDFVLNAYNIIRDNGILTIPITNYNKTNISNQVLLKSLFQQEILNKDPENKFILQFIKKQDIPYRHSTMQFSTNFGVHILFLLSHSNRDLASAFVNSINELAYMEYNIGIKLQVLKLIVNKYFTPDSKISHMDIGGGYGILAAELSLESPCIKKSDILDIKKEYEPIYNILKSYYQFADNRFKFILGDMNNYKFTANQYDLITCFGALLFVEKKNREKVMTKIWRSLKPGGIIVVHENLFNPNVPRHHLTDKMFTGEELYSLLSKYSIVKYYSRSSLEEITREVAEKSFGDAMIVIKKEQGFFRNMIFKKLAS